MKELEPKQMWEYFSEILEIPRLSKHEEKIIKYLEDFSIKHGLEYKVDEIGNCLISKAATPGFEDRSPVILQSHIDMVGEKLLEYEHDFMTDPIKTKHEGDWITAIGTTLGADDGIGVAASMAILASNELQHGPLECLFTVDEETGMTGAFGLQEGFMEGKILLNLDSEDEGEIFIGCAGGIDTVGTFFKETKPVKGDKIALKLIIDGLHGGHSGDEIHKGYGNGIRILNRFLWNANKEYNYRLASFVGGKLRNAIPRDAVAVIVATPAQAELIKLYFSSFFAMIQNEFAKIEPGLKMSIEEVDVPNLVFKRRFQKRLLNMIYATPHGVKGWSYDIPGLVETSTNLAVLRENTDGNIELVTSQRSSSESAKKDISDRIAALFTLAKGQVIHSDGYPGWKPNPNSEILDIAEKTYKKLFKVNPDVKAIHAGLECGLFLKKYPDLDMISFGPTIKGAHTPEERIHIGSCMKFWDFLVAMLENAPRKK